MLKISPQEIQSDARNEGGEAPSIEELLEAWDDAKTQELTANRRRLAVEQQMALLLSAPEEGQKSHRVGHYKVTRTNGINYRGDLGKLRDTLAELEFDLRLTKETLDDAAAKRLRKADRYTFDLLVSEGALTITPAKPHFEVARVPVAELVT